MGEPLADDVSHWHRNISAGSGSSYLGGAGGASQVPADRQMYPLPLPALVFLLSCRLFHDEAQTRNQRLRLVPPVLSPRYVILIRAGGYLHLLFSYSAGAPFCM